MGKVKSTLDATCRWLLRRFESTSPSSILVNSVDLIQDSPNQQKLVELDVDSDAVFSTSGWCTIAGITRTRKDILHMAVHTKDSVIPMMHV